MKVFLLIITMFAATTALAQESDKLDIKKLEQKYWSAKDDDFSVVQNRAFTKEKRYFVDLSYGIPINDPYSTGSISGVTGGYYFSERWGLEFSWQDANLKGNDAFEQFVKEHGTVPNHNILQETYTLSAVYIPFYAKMSFLDKRIIYFDMGFGVGVGSTKYDMVKDKGSSSDQQPHYSFDVLQHFFFTNNFALRVNLKNKWTNEERSRYRLKSGESESNRSLGTSTVNDTSLMLGVTFWL